MEELTEISLRERMRLNLVFAMEKANINQVNLADKLGISKGTVNNWVRGNNSPDVDMVPKICKVLNISVLDLYSSARYEPIDNRKNAPPYSEEALKLATDYDGLDGHGKWVVRLVADEEKSRCKAEREEQMEQASATLREGREQSEAAEDIAPEDIYSIPLYFLPMSAGTGQIAAQEYPEDFLLKKRPPRGTSFIARVSGCSMEPTYYDGNLVFVHATVDIRPGQTGAFLMDGQLWVKELGDGVLISHNPDYEPRQFTEDIRCQGLVLGVCDESYFE